MEARTNAHYLRHPTATTPFSFHFRLSPVWPDTYNTMLHASRRVDCRRAHGLAKPVAKGCRTWSETGRSNRAIGRRGWSRGTELLRSNHE